MMPNSNPKIESIYPLSPMQEGMLFHSLFDPNSGVYFEQLCLTLQGDLNIPAFQKAWQKVIDRHAILRTLFKWERNDKPLQIVLRQARLPWEQVNGNGTLISSQSEMETWLRADRARGFDFSKAPLMRLTLFQSAADTYYFIWSFHHLLLDGWSVSQVIQEVFAFYTAFCQGQDIQPDLPRPYREYIAWLQKQDQKQAESFWRQRLSGFAASTRLPLERSKESPANQFGIDYGLRTLTLSDADTQVLQDFARQNQLTLNTLIQAAWAILLSRYAGQTDVVFGSTVAGRPTDLPGFEKMVGLFINTLPVRVSVDSQTRLVSWLKELQLQMMAMRQYEYCRLVDIQGWSELPRGQALFESILVFENYPSSDLLGAQHSVSSTIPAQSNGAVNINNVGLIEKTNYPLTISCEPGRELKLSASYDRARFGITSWGADDIIAQLLGHFSNLLTGIVAQPESKISELPLLSEVEQQQMLVAWNATAVRYPDVFLSELFAAQVERTPEAIAVIFEDQRLTYCELNERADQLARYLQKSGVGPEVLVGICVERSVEMLVGLLGILKAGGAYVPLDPRYPQERLAFMLAETRASVLLTQAHLRANLPESAARIVCLDIDWAEIVRVSEAISEEIPVKLSGDNLAYVIYTSGSTGQPKGALLTHQGLVNYLNWSVQAYQVEQGAGAPVHSSLGFDLTITSLFPALLSGKSVELLPETQGIEGLSAVLREGQGQAYSLVKITPAHLNALNQELASAQELRKVQRFIIGGEALQGESLFFWGRRLPETRFVNEYGPTETVVGCCIYEVSGAELVAGMLPIGKPIANTQLYVLDAYLQPVPVGVAGELYIGGAGVARGYLNRPDLTAERFIPDPFSARPGGRLYRTGDVARYLPDGNLEFLGRVDSQVKIRGYRIELGEIEAHLRQFPGIQETVVVVREEAPGDKRLVAYFTTQPSAAPTLNDLRDFLRAKLPEYMLPSAYVALESIPLNSNGKVDRRALPSPQLAGMRPEQEYISPRTPTENLVAGVWTEVLGVEHIGAYDNFFDLGGHSLLAMRAASRLSEQIKIDLSIRSLFESPTVASLAERIDTIHWAMRKSQGITIDKPDDQEEITI